MRPTVEDGDTLLSTVTAMVVGRRGGDDGRTTQRPSPGAMSGPNAALGFLFLHAWAIGERVSDQ